MTSDQIRLARQMIQEGKSISYIARFLQIPVSIVYSTLTQKTEMD